MSTESVTVRPPNRLGGESSPYLLQHAQNPVDWYPWGEEAFRAAREQNKPIFLSVGYSTCYWCHVMERQCFENEAIAAEMNKGFINIKVDREERPDVDQLYMSAVQVLTRQGGWPMSVFLTPDLRPFFGGTYFPPEDMHGRPGFPRLLAGLSDAWQNRRPEIDTTVDQLLGILHQLATPRRPEASLLIDGAKLDEYVARAIADYEPIHGGFGRAPKFPRQTLLRFLLAYIDGPARRDPLLTRKVRDMLRHTLDAMDRGGIHDHLSGAFHRYSTDAKWLVPHFEIMLYDQAMLADVYSTAGRVFEDTRWSDVARGICDFVLREMTSPDGAFYTAFDAEVDHYEGLNYLWTEAEIRNILGVEDAALFNCVYGVDQGPNFSDPHQPVEHGAGAQAYNILFLDRPLEQAGYEHGLAMPELKARLAGMRGKLKAVRDQRKQPLLDTKILTGWNALMSSALATCARDLHEPRYLDAAIRNCRFVLARHRAADGGLYRTSRGSGEPKCPAFLDDYAALAQACLATGFPELAADAQSTVTQMLARFGSKACHPKPADAQGEESAGGGACGSGGCGSSGCGSCSSGGLYFTDASSDDLILRQKVASDSPLPSGNAMAATVLLALGDAQRAQAILTEFAQPIDDNVESMTSLAEALLRYVRTTGPLAVAAAAAHTGPRTPDELARRAVEVEARFASDTELEVRLTIADGFHINAPQAADGLVPTELRFAGAETEYPVAVEVKLPFADQPMSVYAGQIVLTARFASPPTEVVQGILRYQPCDDTACLPIITRPIEIHP